MKTAGLFDTVNRISLSQCAVYSEIQGNVKSFNYNEDEQICEVSSLTPDGSLHESTGWKVYIRSGTFSECYIV
jgi:hypothetical protein